MNQNRIGKSATKVILRIILFVLYYIFLIGIGIATIYAITMLTIRYLGPLLLAMPKGYVTVILFVGWVGLCCFGLMFALFLIKPLFSFSKSHAADNAIEIKKEDCPQLFEAIEDIVRNTGNRMPKHVYLSSDVNACVFFDSSFWSIFLPVRKNLRIGLGLFEGLSVDELKSIIAHEFGHFGQSSMKIGSTVYVVHQILYNLTYSHDFWDDLLEKWRSSSATTFAFFGDVTGLFANIVRNMNISMYRFVDRSYLQLSRQMEFDADAVSCKYIGSDAFISAICKTEVSSSVNEFFTDILTQLIRERKVVSNYFDAERVTRHTLPDDDKVDIQYDVPVDRPLNKGGHESRLQIENVWDSHPSLQARIEEARKVHVKSPGVPKESWSLVPDAVRQRMSDAFFSSIDDIGSYDVLSEPEYREWMVKYIEEAYMPAHLRPFFGRPPLQFNKSEAICHVPNPFTEANKAVIDEFKVASSDWEILKGLLSGKVEVESIKYDQRLYTKGTLPIEEHRAYYEDLANQVAAIDRNVYRFLNCHCAEEGLIPHLYEVHVYAYQNINVNLKNLLMARNDLHEELTTFVARSEDDSFRIKQRIIGYVDYLIDSIKELNPYLIETIAGEEYASSLADIMKNAHKGDLYFNNDYLNRMVITLPNELMDIHLALLSKARKELCQVATRILGSNIQEVESMPEESPNIDRIVINTPEEADDSADNPTMRSWLLFGAYIVLVCFLCGSLYYCGRGDNPEKVRDGSTYYTAVTANEGEVSDGRVAIKIPSGLLYDKITPDSEDPYYFGYVFTDDRDNPSYQIHVFSEHHTGAFGENELASLISQYTQSVGLDSVKCETKASSQDLTGSGSDSNVFYYITQTVYETDPKFKADIAVVRSYDMPVICYVLGESLDEIETPFESIVKGIRFK